MAILNAYFDESGKQNDHPAVTFCGVVTSPVELPSFEHNWRALLDKHGLKSLHMIEASDANKHLSDQLPKQTLDHRVCALQPFADCINDLDLGLIEAYDVNGFKALSEQARARIGSPDDPYYTAFSRGILELSQRVSYADQISLICDEDPATAATCRAHYEGVRAADDKVKQKIISLTFASDEDIPGLQAADMVAYLARREARFRFYNKSDAFQDLFAYLIKDRGPAKMKWIALFADEAMLRNLSNVLSK
ncbi:MAG: DUF3800 domain-containing protein [Candidatus Acidiferrales bacterium]